MRSDPAVLQEAVDGGENDAGFLHLRARGGQGEIAARSNRGDAAFRLQYVAGAGDDG